MVYLNRTGTSWFLKIPGRETGPKDFTIAIDSDSLAAAFLKKSPQGKKTISVAVGIHKLLLVS